MYRFANPMVFLGLSARILPWAAAVSVILLAVGLVWSLTLSPPDEELRESVRIMYVHVPAAWIAMFAYTFMAGASLVGFVWRHPLADLAAKSAAPAGACFAALTLITGSIWGKPGWGTFWVWDARLTSMLILFFMYLGYIALWEAIEDTAKAARAAAILAMVGAINIPIIKFSVEWWNTLHQPASISSFKRLGNPGIDSSMLWPLLVMALGYTALFATVLLIRMRTEILQRRLRTLRLRTAEAASSA